MPETELDEHLPYLRMVFHVAERPDVRKLLAQLPLLRRVEDLVDWVGAGRSLDDVPSSRRSSRVWWSCEQSSLITLVRPWVVPGQHLDLWHSAPPLHQTALRLLLVVQHVEHVVRGAPADDQPADYRPPLLFALHRAAAGAPQGLADVRVGAASGAAGNGSVEAVDAPVRELQREGLLDAGVLVAATGPRAAVMDLVILSLQMRRHRADSCG